MNILTILFWLSLILIVYTYLLFPLLIFLRGRFLIRPYKKDPVLPTVSLVMAVHNEEDDLPAKLKNLLSMEYSAEKLEIVIASDGSTDHTNSILQSINRSHIHILLLPRVGKARALNAAVEQAHGEILVFSDANSMYAPDAIQALVKPFADPRIGSVAGNQRYLASRPNNLSQTGEKSYWNFDRALKEYESRAGSVVSATGSIYALRRGLFQPIIEGVTDDFYTSTAAIAQGFRMVFEPEAVSYEPVTADAEREFKRKVRIITRGLRSVIARRALLNPFHFGFYAIQLISHKVLRRLVVLPLLVLFLCSLFLIQENLLYTLAAASQLAFYAAAVLGYFVRHSRNRLAKLASLPFYFTLVNLASLIAVLNILRGNQIARWEPQRVEAETGVATVSPADK
jgi:cellulose synthase/poly-beta-1,6-N-acetylglucosamine synthase-like glycosyltransferase